MIPIPANIKLALLVLIVGAIGALHAITTVEPTWSWVGTTVQVLSLVEAFFTLPSSKKPPVSAAALLLVFGLATTTTACVKNGQVVPPPDPIPQDLQQVAACVMPLLAQGADFPTLVAQCAPQNAAIIIAVLGLLQKSDQLAADDAAVSVQASICYQQARKQGLVKP